MTNLSTAHLQSSLEIFLEDELLCFKIPASICLSLPRPPVATKAATIFPSASGIGELCSVVSALVAYHACVIPEDLR